MEADTETEADGAPAGEVVELLSSMTARLASTADLDEIAETVLREIVALGFGAAWVAVLDEATGNLKTLREVVDGRDTTHEMPPIFMLDMRQPIGHGFRERRMINIKDPDALLILEDCAEVPPGQMALPRIIFEHLRGHPFACGPLLGSRGQPVGAVGLSSYRGKQPIPDEIFTSGLLRAFMCHLGIAMERALYVRRLEELNAELVQTQEIVVGNARMRAVGELAAAVAHDLNNLSGIALMAASAGSRSPAAALEALPRIQRANRAIGDLVARLQRAARTTEAPEATPVDLSAIAEDILFMLGPLCREESIGIETDIASPALVLGDATMVHQIVVNLVLNAREALREIADGERVLRVEIEREGGERDQMRLSVADTGPGFPDEILARAFEPFFSSKGAGHPGLGLATVDSLVKHFGGSLSARNLRDGGARVEVRFMAAAEEAEPVARPATLPEGMSLSVLAVDDDPEVVEIVTSYLEGLDHEAIGVTEPAAALELAHERPFDVILCDVGMPGMSGLDLCSRMRREGVSSKLVLMTGWDHERIRADARQAGCDSILQKPFVGEDLARLLGELMSHRSRDPAR
jgi:signal transduction histidine kinase/CheY-like chemotaxis protein